MESEEPSLPASLLAKAFGVRCIVWLDAFEAWDRFYCLFAFRAIGKLSWNGMICGTLEVRARRNEVWISLQCICFDYAGVDNDSLQGGESVDGNHRYVVN